MAQQVKNPTSIHEDVGSIPGLAQGVRDRVATSCGVGHRHSSDLALLWRRLAAAALIQPLAWEPPYATGVALKRPKKKKIQVCTVYARYRPPLSSSVQDNRAVKERVTGGAGKRGIGAPVGTGLAL